MRNIIVSRFVADWIGARLDPASCWVDASWAFSALWHHMEFDGNGHDKRDMAYLVLPFRVEILYFLFYGPVNIFIFFLLWRHTYQSFRAISRSIISSKGIHLAILAANWSLKLHRDCHLQTSVQFYSVSVHLFLMKIHWWSITGGSLRHERCALPV